MHAAQQHIHIAYTPGRTPTATVVDRPTSGHPKPKMPHTNVCRQMPSKGSVQDKEYCCVGMQLTALYTNLHQPIQTYPFGGPILIEHFPVIITSAYPTIFITSYMLSVLAERTAGIATQVELQQRQTLHNKHMDSSPAAGAVHQSAFASVSASKSRSIGHSTGRASSARVLAATL